MKKLLLLPTILFLFVSLNFAQTKWFKGNTHVHTINSDGDSTPDTVVRWYRENGYHFVVITDHNYITEVEGLNKVLGATDKFIVLKGEEITESFERIPVHTNGINLQTVVLPQGGQNLAEIYNKQGVAIKKAGGLVQLNHPNGAKTIGLETIALTTEINHFEICCSDQFGGGDAQSTEEMWDYALSKGRRIFAIASDDAHSFKPNSNHPGTGWLMIRAAKLTVEEIMKSLETGDFYATTGVEIKEYVVTEKELKIELEGQRGERYRTYFIGKDGTILKRDDSLTPTYVFQNNESYVRARIVRADGKMAWTQPFFQK